MVLIVLATVGIVVAQVIWLKSSYQITKEKVGADAKMVWEESILEHKELVAKQVRRLLKEAIHPADLLTEVHHKFRDGQNVHFVYKTRRYPDGSRLSFTVSLKELRRIQSHPYPWLLTKIDEANLDRLYGVYTSLIGNNDYQPGSSEDQLQDSLMRSFYLHEDTASLNKIVRIRLGRLGYHLATQVIYQKVMDPVLSNASATIENRNITLTEKLDAWNAYVQKLNKKEDQIYISKPILDDMNAILQVEVPVIILKIKISPELIIRQMLFSLIGSVLLLILLASCIGYMFYTILQQKKLSEIKDDFISNVSHELKTPVSTTLAAIQGLQHFDVLEDRAKTERYLATAAQEMKRLSGMIDHILNTAVYERSDFKLHMVRLNHKEMLTGIINIQELYSDKEVRIALNYQASDEIFADKTHLYGVFINLLDNSIKYGHKEVLVKIECLELERGIKILISDNGKGIPTAYQPYIFDKFFRVPSPNDHHVKGQGLGLSYVKNIVEKHKGKIALLKSDNHGSTFEINLPR